MSRLRSAVALLLPLALGACGAAERGGGERWAGTIDTLASGAVHVRSPATGLWNDGEAWRLEEDWRLGSADAEGPELFGQVRALAVDELDRVYVLDPQAREIRVFGPDGAFVRTIGRPGAGPGEFESPNGMTWDPRGRLWVADPRNARYSVFDTTGAFVTSHPRPIRSYGFFWPGAFDREGRLHELDFVRTAPGESEPALVRLDSTVAVTDTFELPRAESQSYVLRAPEGFNRMVASVPFSPRIHWMVDRDGTLRFGDSREYRIVQRSLSGDTLRIVEREHEPVPVTSEEKRVALASEFLEEMRREGADVDPDRVPPHKPAFQGLLTDPTGHLWVQVSTPPGAPSTFDVFDPEGRYLGPVVAPAGLKLSAPLTITEDALYGLAHDELDVPYVVRARIAGRDRLPE